MRIMILPFKENYSTQAELAQRIKHQPANQRVTGLIPSQDTCLGCRPGPQLGAPVRQPCIDVSLPLSPSLSLYENK